MFGTTGNSPAAPPVVLPSVVAGSPVSNGFCYAGGCSYSPSQWADSGLASDSSAFNGLGYSDPNAADPWAAAAASDSGPTSGDWMVGPDGSTIVPVSAASGPVDLGNPATSDESGSGIGSSLLSGLGSLLGSVASGLGSALGVSRGGGRNIQAPRVVRNETVPPLLASRFGGYGNNPYQPAIPVPPSFPGYPTGMISPVPGTPGRFSQAPWPGFGSPQRPINPSLCGPPVRPGGVLPMFAGDTSFSPALSPGYFGGFSPGGFQVGAPVMPGGGYAGGFPGY